MAESNVIVRLSLRDANTVTQGLQSLGSEGERALKRIERAAREPGPGLKALSAASGAASGALQELGSRAGPTGQALAALGPYGLGAAAGLGAIAVVATAVIRHASRVADVLSDLQDAAERTGTSATALRAMEDIFIANASSAEELRNALEFLRAKIGEAAGGSGDAQKTFEAAGISMGRLSEIGGDTAAVLVEISEKTGLTSNQIADLTGRAGKGLVPAMEALNAAGIDLTDKSLDPLSKKLAETQDKTVLLDRQWELLNKETAVNFAESMLAIKQALFDVTQWLDNAGAASQTFFARMFIDMSRARAMSRDLARTGDSMTDDLLSGVAKDPEVYGPPAPYGPFRPPVSAAASTAIVIHKPEKKDKGGGGSKSKKEQKPVSYTGYIGPALGSFRAAQEAGLDEGDKLSATIQKASEAMARLRDENARVQGDAITAIEIRRDRELAALEQIGLSEKQLAEARGLVNDTAQREIADAWDQQLADMEDTTSGLSAAGGTLTSVFEGFGQVTTSAFEDAIIEGGKLSDVMNGLAEDIQRLLLRGSLNNLFKLGGSALASLFGPNLESGGIGTTTSTGLVLHAGGIVGHDYAPLRHLPPALLAGAPRYHTGLRPDEFPAVLQRGEGVFTPAQMQAMGKAPAPVVNVNVINNAGAKVDVQQQQTERGFDLTVLVDAVTNHIASETARPGSTMNRALGRGINPVKAR